MSLVVGVHFLVLGRAFSEKLFWLLGVLISACGTAGLALTAANAGNAAVDASSGVIPGLVLLWAAGWGASQVRTRRSPTDDCRADA